MFPPKFDDETKKLRKAIVTSAVSCKNKKLKKNCLIVAGKENLKYLWNWFPKGKQTVDC